MEYKKGVLMYEMREIGVKFHDAVKKLSFHIVMILRKSHHSGK